MRRWPILLAILALSPWLGGCTEETVPEPSKPRPVRVMEVQRRSDTVPSVLAGVAKAGLESTLSFRVSGTIEKLPIVVGEMVSRGDLLGALDAIDYELALEEARASEAQAEASLRQAIADYGRVRQLYENNNVALSDLDAARAGFESAQAQVEAAQKRIAQAKQQVGYTELRAPTSGAIAEIRAEVNETVSAGQAVVRIASGERPEIEVPVSEVTIPYIRVDMLTTISFDALPNETFEGRVTEVGVSTGSGRSTYPVTVQLTRTSPLVRPGMAAEVRFEIAAPSNARIVVPPLAVGEDRDGRFVFVIDDSTGQTIARRRAVEVGNFAPDGVELLSGVEPGERLITAGVRRLVDGMQVKGE